MVLNNADKIKTKSCEVKLLSKCNFYIPADYNDKKRPIYTCSKIVYHMAVVMKHVIGTHKKNKLVGANKLFQ